MSPAAKVALGIVIPAESALHCPRSATAAVVAVVVRGSATTIVAPVRVSALPEATVTPPANAAAALAFPMFSATEAAPKALTVVATVLKTVAVVPPETMVSNPVIEAVPAPVTLFPVGIEIPPTKLAAAAALPIVSEVEALAKAVDAAGPSNVPASTVFAPVIVTAVVPAPFRTREPEPESIIGVTTLVLAVTTPPALTENCVAAAATAFIKSPVWPEAPEIARTLLAKFTALLVRESPVPPEGP
jgi:hypothetical protein